LPPQSILRAASIEWLYIKDFVQYSWEILKLKRIADALIDGEPKARVVGSIIDERDSCC
jgi:hypothetical protein